MAKKLRDEDLRLNIIVNGDNGRKEIGELKRTIHDTTAQLDAMREAQRRMEKTGKTNTVAFRKLNSEIATLEKALDSSKTRLEKLQRAQSINTMTMGELRAHVRRLKVELAGLDPRSPQWAKFNNELKESNARLYELQAQSKATEGVMSRMAGSLNKYIGVFSAGLASAAFAVTGVNKAKSAFNEFDEALNEMRKTTDFSAESAQKFAKALSMIDTRTALNDLMGIARVGGKLGIAQDDLLGFVKAADILKIALGKDLGDDVETTLGQIGKMVTVFHLTDNMTIDEGMMKVGAAINELGKSSTANEANIVNFTKRVAGVASTSHISIADITGLGASVDATGIQIETAATAISNVITGMFKRTKEFAKVAGMSLSDFKDLLNKDVNEAFIRVLSGMSDTESMENVVAALDSLKIEGARSVTVLSSLANNVDLVRNQQIIASRAFEEGTSCLGEFNIMNNSATASLEKHKKEALESAVALGKMLAPAITFSTSAGTISIKMLTSLVGMMIKYKAIIIGLAIAYGSYNVAKKASVAWEKLIAFWTAANKVAFAQEAASLAGATKSTMALCAAKNLLIGNLRAATIAFKAFFASMGPIGVLSTIIGVLGVAFTHLKDRIGQTSAAAESMNRINQKIESGMADERAKIDSLTSVIRNNQLGINARKKAIQDLQKVIPDYHASISKEGDLIDENTTAINKHLQAMEREIRLTAAKEELIEAHRKVRKLEKGRAAKEKELADAETYNSLVGSTMSNGKVSTPGMRALSNAGTKIPTRALSVEIKKISKELEEQEKIIADLEKEIVQISGSTLEIELGTEESTLGGKSGGSEKEGTPPQTSQQKWALANDLEFQEKRLAIKQQFRDGDIHSEADYQSRLLQLEIDTLQERLDKNIEQGEERIAIEDRLADRQIQQKKQAATSEAEIQKILEDAEADALKRENRRHEQQKAQHIGQNDVLEAIEKLHQRKVAKIQFNAASSRLQQREQQYQIERERLLQQHWTELNLLKGNEQDRRRVKKRQYQELAELERNHLESLHQQLQGLIDTGTIDEIHLDVGMLSSDEILKLRHKLADVVKQLQTEETSLTDKNNFADNGATFLGLSESKWEEIFAGNIEGWQNWADAVSDIVASVGDSTMRLWSQIDKQQSAVERKQLKEFKRNNDKKKKQLENRLNSGLMTEEQYRAEIEKMDLEYEAAQEEIELKQAKRRKAMDIASAIINTSVGVTKSLTGLPWPMNLVAAAATGALGAAQIALIASTPIVAGAERGGFSVERMQDGRKFKARLNPDKRGFVNQPTLLVGEAGSEYVIPNEGLENPNLRPIINMMEAARINGTLKSLRIETILPSVVAQGRSAGGFSTPPASTEVVVGTGSPAPYVEELMTILRRLSEILDRPITAIVSMLGKDGLVKKFEEYKKMKDAGKIK